MITSAGTDIGPTTYLSLVHDGFGFYKIRSIEMPPHQFTYENRVLNINQGDTVIWENDADTSTLTVVSDQKLWDNKVGQIKVGNKINYKFDNPGTYTFYIKEASSKRQTIVVGNVNSVTTPSVTIAAYPTPSPAITYEIVPTVIPTIIPTPTVTTVSHRSNLTQTPVQTYTTPDIELPIKITPTTIASIIVAILSIYITYKTKT